MAIALSRFVPSRQEALPAAHRPGAVGRDRAAAAQELRSADAQVEYLLREALAQRGRRPGPPATQANDPADKA
jgi:hypothetical protein